MSVRYKNWQRRMKRKEQLRGIKIVCILLSVLVLLIGMIYYGRL
jgi:hypothetical protein